MESHLESKFLRCTDWNRSTFVAWLSKTAAQAAQIYSRLEREHQEALLAASSTAYDNLLHRKGPKTNCKSCFANQTWFACEAHVGTCHPIQQAKDGATAAADALRRISEACEKGMEKGMDRGWIAFQVLQVTWTCNVWVTSTVKFNSGQHRLDMERTVWACWCMLQYSFAAVGMNFRLTMKKQCFHASLKLESHQHTIQRKSMNFRTLPIHLSSWKIRISPQWLVSAVKSLCWHCYVALGPSIS